MKRTKGGTVIRKINNFRIKKITDVGLVADIILKLHQVVLTLNKVVEFVNKKEKEYDEYPGV